MGLPLGLFPNWVSLIIQMHTYGLYKHAAKYADRPKSTLNKFMFVLHSIDLWIVILFESMALVSEAHSQDVPLKTCTGQRHSDNWE